MTAIVTLCESFALSIVLVVPDRHLGRYQQSQLFKGRNTISKNPIEMLRNPMKTVIVLLCVEKKLQAQEILSTDNIENCVKETRGERSEIKKTVKRI